MNPGKVINAAKADEHLRFGADYNPWRPQTYFTFPEDSGDFARATERCVGVGKCPRDEGGTMCPSYMVTREEMHKTQGRAHLLWEMLQRLKRMERRPRPRSTGPLSFLQRMQRRLSY